MSERNDNRKQAGRRAPSADRATADSRDALPTWRNTRPRGNQEPHRADLERSVERFEMLLGR